MPKLYAELRESKEAKEKWSKYPEVSKLAKHIQVHHLAHKHLRASFDADSSYEGMQNKISKKKTVEELHHYAKHVGDKKLEQHAHTILHKPKPGKGASIRDHYEHAENIMDERDKALHHFAQHHVHHKIGF